MCEHVQLLMSNCKLDLIKRIWDLYWKWRKLYFNKEDYNPHVSRTAENQCMLSKW